MVGGGNFGARTRPDPRKVIAQLVFNFATKSDCTVGVQQPQPQLSLGRDPWEDQGPLQD
jgi:hypothetical protein